MNTRHKQRGHIEDPWSERFDQIAGRVVFGVLIACAVGVIWWVVLR